MVVDALALVALAAWLGVLLLHAGAWRTRERLDASSDGTTRDLGRVTVLIPARNEAKAIRSTLSGLSLQGRDLDVIVIDDQSEDGTGAVARTVGGELGDAVTLRVVDGSGLPPGWGGKLWALEQGLRLVDREYCLLLDAEIELRAGVLGALLDKADQQALAQVSVMATLRCVSLWEKLLVPPFIFFFKLIYPFARVNDPRKRTAAAAGGCILIRTDILRGIGGFSALRGELIDDCALARSVKRSGSAIWLGMSHDVSSLRSYPDLASFRRMVTRTAFTQLNYSLVWLALVVLALCITFFSPFVALAWSDSITGVLAGLGALAAMGAAFWPTVRFYGLLPVWVLTLPVAASLFLAMTLESAFRYWCGIRATWKGRTYARR